MVIRTQTEDAIYDANKFSGVYAVENDDGNKDTNPTASVLGLGYTGERAFPLGQYKNLERAKEVVGEIFALCMTSTLYEMPIV